MTAPISKSGQVHLLHPPRRHDLRPVFAPRSIAIIGASEALGSVGRSLVENLRSFSKPVYLVNPKHDSVLGARAYPNIASLPGPVDLAVIATPAATVPGIVRECVQHQVPGAVIISAGFKECGTAGQRLEQEVLTEARRGGMRMIGPNCLGLMMPHAGLNATFAGSAAIPGSVAFLSQSGALCTAVLDWSLRKNVGFSGFVSAGSLLDVGWGDLIYYFGDDPHTRSIVCYMESVGDARAFMSAAREVARSKPVIVLKVGRTTAAAQAAASHTGALTGSDAVLDAAFRRAGVLRVDSLNELFDMADVLSKQPRPRGPRLCIVTNAGGAGALATDSLVSSGGRLSALSTEGMNTLNEVLPAHWSHGNPVDILGDADVGRYSKAVEIAMREPGADGVCVILSPQAMTEPTAIAKELGSFEKPYDKPILACWMGGATAEEGRQVLSAANIPVYSFPETAARSFALMWRYSDNLRALYETPSLPGWMQGEASAKAKAEGLIQTVRQAGRTVLTEAESKQVLADYGIPVVQTHVARSVDEAVQLADRTGYPVAIKLFSETITHKSDVGGVHLQVRDAASVRSAWASIQKNVSELVGPQHFLGVTVQPMISQGGFEVILGSSTDAQFGPVLLFGTGGKYVEVFQDRAIGLPPLNSTLALRLMERTKCCQVLRGVRGQKPVDLEQLSDLLVRFSNLVIEQKRIAEIDINPLLVSADGMVALDARVVLHPANLTDEQIPRPAIRPYPAHYITPWKLKDGSETTIRPIRPEDEPLLIRFHHTLSERSVYHRYFNMLGLDQRVAHERLSRICYIDYDTEMAFVVERSDPHSGQPEILGVGRLGKLHGKNEAEFALIVSDRWQGHGLGTQLLGMLVQVGRDEGLQGISGIILAENSAMLHVATKLGFTLSHTAGDSEYKAALHLLN